nr:leucyl/phenylalanyl-tRNA--protein transferase [Paracoccus sp. S-4012]
MLRAYAAGIFPMADAADDPGLHWIDPPFRGVLPVGGIHASRSLRRSLRRGGWSATLNARFEAVVDACADRPETWINAPLRGLYRELHAMGFAHSLEVWREGELAGGTFGIALGGAWFGESMFSARTDGSKLALLWLSHQLGRCGFRLFDTQFSTPHLESLGGREISRRAYRAALSSALSVPASLSGPLPEAAALLQETTQMS